MPFPSAAQTSGIRARLGRRLRFAADRIDPEHAFRATAMSFTFERGQGMVARQDERGCPLWYYGPDYDRAHAEADSAGAGATPQASGPVR